VQEFPDDWEFCGKPIEQYIQVGNAVPVGLGRIAGIVVAGLLDEIVKSGKLAGKHEPCRVIYVKSHIRTRQWFKAGETFLWQDGEENGDVKYGPAKTQRKVRKLEQE